MKKGKLILVSLALLGLLIPPTVVAKAGPGPIALLHMSFCGTQFHFETDDYPTLYFDSVDVYDSSGILAESISVYGHNAEWRDVGFAIGHVVGHWREAVSGGGGRGGGPIQADTPICVGTKLIDMYVYYSSDPFFGNTHTLTIYSALGFPSKAVVTALAGGRLPDGFEYGAPACWGALYDNGSDKGWFECDGFLASVGERRAYLRNDPEGADFDLLPKIEKYYEMLKGMGVTPQSP
jgi:hypothetical protein